MSRTDTLATTALRTIRTGLLTKAVNAPLGNNKVARAGKRDTSISCAQLKHLQRARTEMTRSIQMVFGCVVPCKSLFWKTRLRRYIVCRRVELSELGTDVYGGLINISSA